MRLLLTLLTLTTIMTANLWNNADDKGLAPGLVNFNAIVQTMDLGATESIDHCTPNTHVFIDGLRNHALSAKAGTNQAGHESRPLSDDTLARIFRIVVGCDSKSPCSTEMDDKLLANWLINNQLRDADHRGKSVFLTFNDFERFRPIYGNALAKYDEIIDDFTRDVASRLFLFNDGSDNIIVVENNDNSLVDARTHANANKFAPELRKLMDANATARSASESLSNT